MSLPPPIESVPYRLEPMTLEDIPAVMAIDAQAYPTPWKASGYQYELTSNERATYRVLRPRGAETPPIIGYYGYWLIADECHVSTIAVAPAWQGRGLGELLFWHLLWSAMDAGATIATLEVREHNRKAQALYRKYGLQMVGRRRHYYRDTMEDALLMTVSPLDTAYRTFLQGRAIALGQRLGNHDHNQPPTDQ